eukprot:m.69745 g.69745  ORF g.69745 m.69745 type:complete len:768 (+) comp11645_c0_seq1:143-2446(+)
MSDATLKVVKTVSQDLAVTNRLIVSSSASPFPPSVKHVVMRPKEGGTFYCSLQRDDSVREGTIAANSAHRTWAKLDLGEPLSLQPMTTDFVSAGTVALELSFWKKKQVQKSVYKMEEIIGQFRQLYAMMVISVGQLIFFRFQPSTGGKPELLAVTVKSIHKFDECSLMPTGTDKMKPATESVRVAIAGVHTTYTLSVQDGCQMRVSGGSSSMHSRPNIINPNWKFEDMGIGGLDDEFTTMFRRAFASRVMPPELIEQLGVQYCKGILLHGPPGTGKTLMARKIGMMLEGREPKIVSGPEVLSKFVGQAEENIRELFADAEAEFKAKGDMSALHIIIFDEMDAICKTRGSVTSGTGVYDSIVNQLLSKIDGVEALNNILLIGMTNRIDMIDEALLRPGRFELKMQIGLPDEYGRKQIFSIHTQTMRENKKLAEDVDMEELAAMSKNFSGAEIAGVCRSAASFATNRCIEISDGLHVNEEELKNIKVTREDFLLALNEVTPAFGAATEVLDDCARNGIVHWGDSVDHILADGKLLIQQVEVSERTPIVSLLLSGVAGSGKTALAATLALQSSFPYVKLITPETLVGRSEYAKVQAITKAFEDAYKSKLSVVVVDDIERLLDYSVLGNRFSNVVLQSLLVLFKKPPPQGHKLFVVGTTSNHAVLELMGMTSVFSKVMTVDTLTEGHEIMRIIDELQPFDETEIESCRKALSHGSKLTLAHVGEEAHLSIGVKKVYMLVEMARQAERDVADKFLESLYDECKFNKQSTSTL